jgi:DNA primase
VSDEIKQIAQTYLRKVKPSGNEDVMAICPFHSKSDGTEERNPSFAMNVYSGLWYCHSCHARGNLYSFLRNVGLPRADIEFYYKGVLEEAAQYAPKPPNPLDPVQATKEPLEESLLGLFDFCPKLLLDEGYPEELLRQFDVGYDEKHQRITFPLRNIEGALVGLSGRTVTGAFPRYKIYDKEYLDFGLPERKTEKRALLWNAHRVLVQHTFHPDPDEQYVVITEGFKAVMRVAQAGINNVVGLLGSYMSQEQQWVIERLMDGPIFMMLDNNDAGRLGQLDATKRLMKTVPNVWVVDYDAAQPSELSTTAIQEALLAAKPALTWLTHQAAAAY